MWSIQEEAMVWAKSWSRGLALLVGSRAGSGANLTGLDQWWINMQDPQSFFKFLEKLFNKFTGLGGIFWGIKMNCLTQTQPVCTLGRAEVGPSLEHKTIRQSLPWLPCNFFEKYLATFQRFRHINFLFGKRNCEWNFLDWYLYKKKTCIFYYPLAKQLVNMAPTLARGIVYRKFKIKRTVHERFCMTINGNNPTWIEVKLSRG